ncbi:response regulator [Paenibacillus aurantius]|uniref:Response regulator n=1 Tax=Paenibacillus aurantius TaxID=2918900 RepID=A0AA96RJ62_9BACL|nr:response regulator [Paenibacillus aurantius]WNQ12899.1 response regulator [Paenibacillus aurantius]
MINLIIIDDEETTRSSLMELVPWSEVGVSEVRTAENGVAALALAESFKPSIILTDIRMPKMNGIELSQNIRKLYPECEIIFLSGFSDKEYLKSAIQLNAVDYLDKPVDLEELKVLFVKIIRKLRDADRRNGVLYQRQEIVLDMISQNIGLSEWLKRSGPAVVQLSDQGMFIVYTALFNWAAAMADDERAVIKHNILKLLNDQEPFVDTRHIAGFLNDNCLALVINSVNYREAKCKEVAESLLNLLQEAKPDAYSLSIGCSHPSLSPNEFSHLYKTSLEAAKKQFYFDPNKVFFANSVTGTNYDIDKSAYTRFKKMLRNGSVDDAVQLIRLTTEEIARTGDPDTNKIRNLYFNFLRILFEVTMQWDAAESGDDKEMIYMWREIDTLVSLKELAQFLISNIKLVFPNSDNKASAVEKIDEIKKYIAVNYSSNQLSIHNIAQHTFLSHTYLCAYFKKSTGRTLNEYITELRIEKAKELLRDRNHKLYEITNEIGLTDTNYFSTLFKRYTGLTPSEYRVKHFYDEKIV